MKTKKKRKLDTNELRLVAHECIIALFQAKAKADLRLLLVHAKSALFDLGEK